MTSGDFKGTSRLEKTSKKKEKNEREQEETVWDHLLEFLLREEQCRIPCGSGKGWGCPQAPGPAAPALAPAPGMLFLKKKTWRDVGML